jgi:hypothetical protein
VNGNCPKHLRNGWLTACSALVLALAGCGGDDQPDNSPRIEPATATELADRSEEIARLLDEDKVCDAAHAADELKAQVEAEIADGSVPTGLAEELDSNAQLLVDQVNCEAPPPPPTETEEEEEGKGNGKGKGRDKDGDD